MKKIWSYLGAVAPAAAAMGIMIAVSGTVLTLIGIIFGVVEALKGKIPNPKDSNEVARTLTKILTSSEILLISTMAGAVVCGIVFLIWYRNVTKYANKTDLRKLFTIPNVLLIILIGIACQGFIGGIMSLVQPYFKELFSDYAKVINSLVGGNIILVVLYTVIIAPIAEELVFRGVVLQKASKVIPFLGANILQAALFGIYHMNIVQGVYAFILGLLFGLVCNLFKTIYASIMLHMIVNASSFLFMYIPESITNAIIMTLVGGIVIVICYVTLSKWNKIIMKEETLNYSIMNEDQLK